MGELSRVGGTMRVEGWCIVKGRTVLRSPQRTGTLSSAKAETFYFLIYINIFFYFIFFFGGGSRGV